MPPLLTRVLGGFGRAMVTVGVLLLLFAGFQLWGTGVAESRAQADLERRFEEQLAQLPTPAPPTEQSVVEVPKSSNIEPVPDLSRELVGEAVAVSAFQPDIGDPVGLIEIPAIGVSKTIVEGTNRDVLREGPGHYRSTPLPGRSGNTAIAGHRTTHGAPFFDIDLLAPGDEISVQTLEGTAVYRVEAHDNGAGGEVGHLIVDPSEVGVIADQGDNRLTLTACHPKYSAAQRIIVTATMVSGPAIDAPVVPTVSTEPGTTGEPAEPDAEVADAEPTGAVAGDRSIPVETMPGQDISYGENTVGEDIVGEDIVDEDAVAASLGWQPQFVSVTAIWATVTALIAVAASVAGRLWRRFPAYAMAVPPLTLALFRCFTNLEKLLPAV